jgi:hypothetical protein
MCRTLCRHLDRLAQGNIVSVVAESRVRGATERTYAVALDQAAITEAELRHLGRDDHMRLFMAFIASVIDGFQRYLDQGHVDVVADGVTYSQATLRLDDDQRLRLRAESAVIVEKAMAPPPEPGRRARVVSSIVAPEPVAGTQDRSVAPGRGEPA